MSRSQLAQERKSLDSFVWVNEITGEVTLPPGEETALAASSGEKQRRAKKSGSWRGSAARAAAAPRPASPANPEAAGGALPEQHPLGASPPPAMTLPASPSPPWALPCKLRNVLTGSNRFSF
ncbi:uncharacterized protein C3orf86 homolog [Cricetulus griseus]|uniref:Predicted gene, 35549 n=1 Tax=Cricetulus griseus TaxID=10029 RepID=A0A8C2LTA3_CRIGR|nr:uncharacterized protein C3orf86 homolog [Cricetulus griseus]XP_027291191.2 uncharacterized protein C3orf86 homolog [Cricetulus griseus]